MTSNVLMPKATAVWLIENTPLAFKQIADFTSACTRSEVQGIANEDVAKGIRGVDLDRGRLPCREEIAKGEGEETYVLKPLGAEARRSSASEEEGAATRRSLVAKIARTPSPGS
ncbi:MAG: cell cycle transcriptional regulator TrcR [Hyphomonadaceae bacterium]